MKGSHTVEGFLNWLDQNDNIGVITKVGLKKKIKEAADNASATGSQGLVKILQTGKHVMSVRVFDDGSCEAGWDTEAFWPGKDKGLPPGLIPPDEKEI